MVGYKFINQLDAVKYNGQFRHLCAQWGANSLQILAIAIFGQRHDLHGELAQIQISLVYGLPRPFRSTPSRLWGKVGMGASAVVMIIQRLEDNMRSLGPRRNEWHRPSELRAPIPAFPQRVKEEYRPGAAVQAMI